MNSDNIFSKEVKNVTHYGPMLIKYWYTNNTWFTNFRNVVTDINSLPYS
jgi:hypothetical protein